LLLARRKVEDGTRSSLASSELARWSRRGGSRME
jgi:hypothetical protein